MKYIDNATSLKDVYSALGSSEWVAVDTEADSLHHYLEQLCLLQISVSGEDFVIDPLAPIDLKGLIEILNQKLLILHGADFDIRILRRFFDFHPKELFDTMLAAQLLGYEKLGLADLAAKHCDVHLSKTAQKADWSKRPLDKELLAYAANDTHYLKPIYDGLQIELSALGRQEWQRQQCQRLLKHMESASSSAILPIKAPWQIKSSKTLSPRALTFLRELWLWREAEARHKNRPVFKTLNSEYLIGIAQWCEKNPGADIQSWPRAPRNVKREYREVINNLILKAAEMPETEFVQEKKKLKKRRWGTAENERFKALKIERDRIGGELKIRPSLLAPNAVLEILSEAAPRDLARLSALDCMLPWQIEIAGETFLKAINAKYPGQNA